MIDPPTEATTMGNFVHETLEELHQEDPDLRTKERAGQIMRTLWDSKWGDQAAEILRDDTKALHKFRWKSYWCIENYFNLEDPTEVFLDGIEHAIEDSIQLDDTNVVVKGFVDRWEFCDDGSIKVSDYKTGKTPRPQWVDDKFQQLQIYAVFLQKQLDAPVKNLELLYLKDGTRYEKQITQAHLDETVEVIVAVRKSIDLFCEQKTFPAHKSKLCDWCAQKSICPAWN
jgi:putative RecB family exonuclease